MTEKIFHPHPNPLPSRARDKKHASLSIKCNFTGQGEDGGRR